MRSLALLPIALAACTSEPPAVAPARADVEPQPVPSATASDMAPAMTTPTEVVPALAAPIEPFVPWMEGLPRFDGMHEPTSAERVPGFTRFAVTGDLEKAAHTWIDRSTREGVRFLGDHRGSAWRSYSFELKGGARGNVVLTSAAAAGKIDGALGQARDAPVKLSGACVPIPATQHVVKVSSTGIGHDGMSHTGELTYGVETMFFWDLDGDGQVDALAPLPGAADACPWAVEYEAYVMRGTCGHDVGRVGPGFLAVPQGGMGLPMTGLLPLKFTSEWSALGRNMIPVHTTRATSFVFSGTRYRKVDDQTTESICHHCARSMTCRVLP